MRLKCNSIEQWINKLYEIFDKRFDRDNEWFDAAILAAIRSMEEMPCIKCKDCHYWVALKSKTGICGLNSHCCLEDDFCSNFEAEV